MQVGRVLAQLPVVLPRNGEVVIRLGAGRDIDGAEATGFFDALLRPDTGVDVVGNAFFRQQVQRNLGELLAGTTLQEQHFVVGRDGQQVTQVLFGFFRDGHVVVAAMAHLHHRQAFALPVQQIRLGTQQNSFGKRGRAGAEVMGSFAHIDSHCNRTGRLYGGRSI